MCRSGEAHDGDGGGAEREDRAGGPGARPGRGSTDAQGRGAERQHGHLLEAGGRAEFPVGPLLLLAEPPEALFLVPLPDPSMGAGLRLGHDGGATAGGSEFLLLALPLPQPGSLDLEQVQDLVGHLQEALPLLLLLLLSLH